MIDLLIQYGADIQEHGLICDAVGDAEMIEWLIKQGASIRNQSCWNRYLVYRKKDMDEFKGAEILLKHGEGINAPDAWGRTPLHDAVSNDNQNAVRWLLDHGADVNALDKQGKACVYYSYSGNVDIIKMLYSHGAVLKSEEIREYTAGACGKQNLSVLKFISGKGITPDYDACYAALAYESSPDQALISWLTARSKIRNNPFYDASLLHRAAGNKNVEIVRMLIKTGVDVNVKDRSDQTPLHYAAGKNSLEIAGLLIKAGADVNAKDKSGQTPLNRAIEIQVSPKLTYNKEMVSLLLDNGADPNIPFWSHGRSYLHKLAERAGYTDVKLSQAYSQIQVEFAEMLINAGADVNARRNANHNEWESRTPLHIAAESGNIAMIRLLVAHGGDLRARTLNLLTPLQHAILYHGSYDNGHKLLTLGTLLSLEEHAGIKPNWDDLKEEVKQSRSEKNIIVIKFFDRLSKNPPGPARYKNLEAIVAELVYDTPEALKDRMKSCDQSVALAAAETATRNPDILKDPYNLYGISSMFFQHGKKDEAVFWFYAAQLRERYQWCYEKNNEHERLPFPSPEMFLGPAISSYAFRDTVKLRRIIDQVLVWDAKTSNPKRTEKRTETIDQRIMQLYAGYQEFKAWLIADKEKLEQKTRRLAPEIEKTFFDPLFSRCRDVQKVSETKSKATEPYYIGK